MGKSKPRPLYLLDLSVHKAIRKNYNQKLEPQEITRTIIVRQYRSEDEGNCRDWHRKITFSDKQYKYWMNIFQKNQKSRKLQMTNSRKKKIFFPIFYEKISVFFFVVGGFLPTYISVVRPLKKVVFPLVGELQRIW